jgi:hypothetical protein
MILLYAIVPADQAMQPMWKPGAELRIVAHETLAAVYEELESARSPSVEVLTQYGGVLLDLTRRCPVLPVRFGTVLPDLEELRAMLSSRHDEWAERLAQVAGNVELIVHLPYSSAGSDHPESRSGREYLLARVSAHKRRQSLQQALISVVEAHCLELRWLRGVDELRLACLVPAGEAEPLRIALGAWAGGDNGAAPTVTGPFPVLSFAERHEDDESAAGS